VFKHHWGRTLTEYDGIIFSTTTMNYNPSYFNAEYARKLGYTGIIINPLLVFNTILGLSVEDLSEAGGPFLGVDNVKYYRPVYPGDTIYSKSVVLSRRLSGSRPGWGIVEWKTTGYNQNGEIVADYCRRNLAKLRDVQTAKE